jgi:hypothetical protein
MAEPGAEDELTTPAAAAYLGMTRQALTIAAERGEIGRKRSVIGRTPPYVWVFTRRELDAWKARVKNRGGRPKSDALMATPAIRV